MNVSTLCCQKAETGGDDKGRGMAVVPPPKGRAVNVLSLFAAAAAADKAKSGVAETNTASMSTSPHLQPAQMRRQEITSLPSTTPTPKEKEGFCHVSGVKNEAPADEEGRFDQIERRWAKQV